MFGALQLGLGLAPRTGSRGVRAYAALSNKPNGFAFDPLDDFVLVKDAGTPANNFCGSMAQALAAGILNYPSPSTKYVRNAAGVYVPGTTLRCQYSATGTPLGILSEPQRQNLWLRSSDLSVSPWIWSSSGGGETVLPGDTSVYGDTLWTITLGTLAADRRQYKVVAANTQTSVAFNVKRGNQPISSALYQVLGGTGTQTAYLSYNHDTDTVTAGISGVGGIVLNDSGREILSDGEVHVWLVFTPSNGGTTGYVLLHRRFGASFASTDTAQYGHVQVEYGAYPTSYTKTEASAVTRAADDLYVDLTKIPALGSEFTVIGEAEPCPDTTTSDFTLFSCHDDTNDKSTTLFSGTAGAASLIARARSGAATVAQITATGAAAAAFKVAVARQVDDFEFVTNGTSAGIDTSAAFPTGLTKLQIGRDYTALRHWAAPIRFLALIPERLSQADMIARTS